MRNIAILSLVLATACAGSDPEPKSNSNVAGAAPDSGVPDNSDPEIIRDSTRQVTTVALTVTDQPRNACTLGITKYITQYVAVTSTCGDLPDQKGDYTGMSQQFLSIPSECTLGHFYNQDPECTITTELTCTLPDGCVEVRYLDYSWRPATLDNAPTVNEAFLGDGTLKLTRTCPGKPDCAGTYWVGTYTQL